MNIGLDMDGVCYDFVGSLKEWLKRPDLPDAKEWDFFKSQWGMTPKQFTTICNEAVDAEKLFKFGRPIPGALSGTDLLVKEGHSLHIITNRFFGRRSSANTEFWLWLYGVSYDSLNFLRDKTLLNCDVFIDDSPENIEALEAAGKKTIVFDQPWNSNVTAGVRAKGWGEVIEIVREMNAAV